MAPALRIVLTAGLAAVLTLSATAQPKRDHEMEIDRLRGEIRSLRARLEGVRKQATTVETELQAIDLELAIVTRELESAIELGSQLEGQRQLIIGRISTLNEEIARHRGYLAKRLSALYRLGRMPYLRMLLSVGEQQNPLEASTALAYLVGRDARAVSSFRLSQEQLVLEEARLMEKEQELSRTRRVADGRRSAAAKARRQKSALLAKLRRESQSREATLRALEEKAERLERLFTLLYQRESGAASGRISEFRGALPWPVQGEVVESFGRQQSTRFQTFIVSNGIRIAAEPGNEVRAVFAGTVLFAQWFKGYGNLIILDHGDRIFSLYGNTRGTTLSVGDRVEGGQTVALVSEGEEGEEGSLYFEIRENNEPVDPRRWLR